MTAARVCTWSSGRARTAPRSPGASSVHGGHKRARRRDYRRLSASPIWAANRRYYDRTGIDAWRTGTVPHYVTNSVALATAYARVVLGYRS